MIEKSDKKKKFLVHNQWISVWKDVVVLPDKKIIPDYYFVKRADVVAIVPILPDRKVVMLKQWRPIPRRFIYNVPMGLIEKREKSDYQAARRELKEEVGCRVKKWVSLGAYWRAPSYLTTKVSIFLAMCEPFSFISSQLDITEIATPKPMKFSEAKKRTEDLTSLCALFLAEKYIKTPSEHPLFARGSRK